MYKNVPTVPVPRESFFPKATAQIPDESILLASMAFCQERKIDEKNYYFAPNAEHQKEYAKNSNELKNIYNSIPKIFSVEVDSQAAIARSGYMSVAYNPANTPIPTNIPQKNYFFITPCLTTVGFVIYKIYIEDKKICTTQEIITKEDYIESVFEKQIIPLLLEKGNFSALSTWEVMEKAPFYFDKIRRFNPYKPQVPSTYFLYLGHMPEIIVNNYLDYILIPKIHLIQDLETLENLGNTLFWALREYNNITYPIQFIRTSLSRLEDSVKNQKFHLTFCCYTQGGALTRDTINNDMNHLLTNKSEEEDHIQNFIQSYRGPFSSSPNTLSLLKITDLWEKTPKLKELKQNFYSPEEFKRIFDIAHPEARSMYQRYLSHEKNSQQSATLSNT